MESFCKQTGLRMKSPGMRWSVRNVSPMAALVSRWSLDDERCDLFGAAASTNFMPAIATFFSYTRFY